MVKKIFKTILWYLGYVVYKKNGPDVLVNTNEQLIIPRSTDNVPLITETHYVLPKSMIRYANDLLYTAHNCDFIEDPKFKAAYEKGKATDINKTVLHQTDIQWRIHVLCWAASQVIKLEGDFVDCGVNTGIFARAVIDYTSFENTNKTYFLLDTFDGLDEKYSTLEEQRNGLNTIYKIHGNELYEQVVTTFSGYNVRIIKGSVPDTLPEVTADKIAYLSIDMNCALPEKEALEYFWNKMVSGGIIILDDYGYNNQYLNQKRVHDAFAKSKNVEILTLPTCQGLIIKP